MNSIQTSSVKKSPPSDHWFKKFQQKQDLRGFKENPLEKERSENATRGNIRDWFSKIGSLIDMTRFKMGMVGNMDETMCNFKGRSIVFGKKDNRTAVTVDDQGREHITILQTILNNGDTFTPMYVLPLKKVPTYLDDQIKKGRLFLAGQKSGWIDDDSFCDYIEKFGTWLHRERHGYKANEPFLMFSDSHGSRKDFDLLKFCKINHITLVTFYSHTTHILQPLDVGVFAIFKKFFRQEKRQLRDTEITFEGEDGTETASRRVKNILASIEALHLSTSPRRIESAFKYSGLSPWDVEMALRNPRIHPKEEITINNRKRKGIQMDGRVVTSKEFMDELEAYETLHPKSKPKKKKFV